jgi:hypothetical protein
MLVQLTGVLLEVAEDEGRLLGSHSLPDPPDEVTMPSACLVEGARLWLLLESWFARTNDP